MSRAYHLSIALLLAAAIVGLVASPASAHADFESSDPADGATVEEPVSTITLVFTGETELVGVGFEVLDAAGQLRSPDRVTADGGRTWVLHLDPPISGGQAGVRWMVKAPDAHPLEGSFSFTVSAPPVAVAGSEAAPSGPAVTSPAAAPGIDMSQDPLGDLNSFLDTAGDTTAARRLGVAGRAVGIVGTLTGVGALAFAAMVLRGERRDIRYVLFWVRRAGLLVVAGTLVEVVAKLAVEGGGSWSAALQPSTIESVIISQFGLAAALRLIGGCAVASGARFRIAHASETPDPVVAMRELVGVGAGPRVDLWGHVDAGFDEVVSRGSSEPYLHDDDHAWMARRESSGAFVGVAALLIAYLFDGHTVSKGNRVSTAMVDLVHVAGAAIWAGGLFMLVAVLWRRHRQGRELRALQLAVRFSVVAAMALVAVGVAGLVLTVIVLDRPSELWSTAWGRLLMAKTVFVALAGLAGAYNHKILIPQLGLSSEDSDLSNQFRMVVSLEAAALVLVVVLTAFLVGAAS